MDQLLDIDELVADNKKQESNRLGVFESILAQCHGLIKRNNKDRIREMYYNIPAFVFGKPKYDIDVLRNYLVHHLRDNGLRVDIVDRYHLYISWKETDIDLSKYLHRKTLIHNRHSSLYMVPSSAPPISKDRIEMMKFRQERQRQLQEERQQRFELQKSRIPLPEMDFSSFIKKY